MRAAIVQLGSEGNRTEIKRPVQRLYPVEVSEDRQYRVNKEKEDAAQPVVDLFRTIKWTWCVATDSICRSYFLRNVAVCCLLKLM